MDVSFIEAHKKYGTAVYHVMVKPVGPVCNLDCTYCYYLEKKKLYQGTASFRMADEVLESFTRQYLKSQDSPVVTFVWQGGEPTLLGKEFFEKALYYQKKYQKRGQTIENALQTNATLLDDDWGQFLAANGFLVGVSIDGPRQLHDHYRRDKRGNGTFQRVMKGIERLKAHHASFNTLTTVHNHNSQHPLEVYRFLKSIGSRFMQFIPIVEQMAEPKDNQALRMISPDSSTSGTVTEWSTNPLEYGRFLSTIFDEWVTRDVGEHYVQIFDATLANWVNQNPGLCVFGRTCGDTAVIEHNGDLYSCDHFVYHENHLGNILETPLVDLMKSQQQINFGFRKESDLPEKCKKCRYRPVCRGGCPKNRLIETDEPGKRLNYLCNGYQHFFGHIAPYMNFMADELKHRRPPANVMPYARRHLGR